MAHFGASFKTLHILYVYITITNKYSVSFSLHTLLSDGRTAAARCTSVRRTSRRTLTTIAKSRRSSRKDFNDFVRLKTATRRRASSWIRKRHISTAVDLAAATLSKINQTWVRAGALQILCLYQFRLWDIMFLSRPFRPSVRALWKLWTRYFWKGMNGICCKLAQVFHGGTQVFHWGGKGMKRSTGFHRCLTGVVRGWNDQLWGQRIKGHRHTVWRWPLIPFCMIFFWGGAQPPPPYPTPLDANGALPFCVPRMISLGAFCRSF